MHVPAARPFPARVEEVELLCPTCPEAFRCAPSRRSTSGSLRLPSCERDPLLQRRHVRRRDRLEVRALAEGGKRPVRAPLPITGMIQVPDVVQLEPVGTCQGSPSELNGAVVHSWRRVVADAEHDNAELAVSRRKPGVLRISYNDRRNPSEDIMALLSRALTRREEKPLREGPWVKGVCLGHQVATGGPLGVLRRPEYG